MKNSQIKILTKGVLNGNVAKSVSFLLLSLCAVIVFTAIPFAVNRYVSDPIICAAAVTVSLAVFVFARCGFSAGSEAWFSFYKRKNRASRAIYWFAPRNNFKAFRLHCALFFAKLFWTILMLLPGTRVIFSFCYLAYDAGIEFNLFLCGVTGGAVLIVTGFIFRFLIVQKYFLAKSILIENPSVSVLEAIRQSCEKINGKLKKTAFFKLSFTPWILTCVGILPLLYVWPYYRQSCALFAEEIRK